MNLRPVYVFLTLIILFQHWELCAQHIIPFQAPDNSNHKHIQAGRVKATLRFGYLIDNPEAESLRERVEYNKMGMQTLVYKFRNEGGVESKTEYEYDASGLRILKAATTTLKPDGDLLESLFYRFDPKGNLLEYHRESAIDGYSGLGITYDPEGRVLVKQVFEKDRLPGASELYGYNQKGHLTSIVHKDISGSTTMLIQYEPNAAGKPAKESHWYEAKVLLFTLQYQYDVQGRVLNREKVNRAGEITSRETYKYDEKGRMILQSTWEEGEEKPIEERLSYDAKGRMSERKVTLPDGVLFQWTRFKYDSTGTGAGFNKLNEEGNVEMEEVTIFDHQGRKMEWRSVYLDGSGMARAQYRYDGYGLIMEEKLTATDQEQATFWFVHERY